MITAAWNMLQSGEFNRGPGADYYTRSDPAKARARARKQLQAIGYQVTIQPPHKPDNPHRRPAPRRTASAPTACPIRRGHQVVVAPIFTSVGHLAGLSRDRSDQHTSAAIAPTRIRPAAPRSSEDGTPLERRERCDLAGARLSLGRGFFHQDQEFLGRF